MKKDYLEMMRKGEPLTLLNLIAMTVKLSIPTILAQVSFIIMEYIDAAMVGRLGTNATAAIGLVSSSTWLLGGLVSSASIGFTVLVSQSIGAGDEKGARHIMKTGFAVTTAFSFAVTLAAAGVHSYLPHWLGGESGVCENASSYFLIFALFLPFQQLNNISAGMLQSSGNMRAPGILEALMCVLDVIYNYIFIFILELGVTGAAIGTALSQITIAFPMLYILLKRSKPLHLRKGEPFSFDKKVLKKAVKISAPVGIEQLIMSSAYIMSTRIVAPLGSVAVAAHSLAVTAESLCYMPGYGIGTAATTMIGQSVGAKRYDLKRRLSYVTTLSGMAMMGITGCAMFFLAPYMMKALTPVPEIFTLGAEVLRIEAFAEPMFAASIVVSGVFRGAGDTLVPSIMNLVSMWGVRIPLSAALAPKTGLKGVWIAMCIELCFRGAIFLTRLIIKNKKDTQ